VVSQLGRPDDGTDVSGFYNIEFFAPLKPFDEWPRGVTKDKLTEQINKELSRRSRRRLQLLAVHQRQRRGGLSGVKGENSVKVFGNDLESNEKIAEAIVDVMAKVPAWPTSGTSSRWGSRASRSRPTARSARATA
jgi:cobalt-zinc-cadmium resistance protein CzcA